MTDTTGEYGDATRVPQQRWADTSRWDRDLHPDRGAGQHYGAPSGDREIAIPTAFDVKEVHRALRDFPDDDLKQIPILREGTPLKQGATYVDLAAPRPEEVKFNAGKRVEPGHYYVPKDRVPYWIWNRIIGEPKPGQ